MSDPGSTRPSGVIELVAELTAMLASNEPSLVDVAGLLGPATTDPAGNLAVRAVHPEVSAAYIVRRSDTAEPSFVRLDLRAPAAVRELIGAFGEPSRPPPRPGGPPQLIFPVHPAAPLGASVIAEVVEDDRSETTTALVVRRDRRQP